MIIRYVIALILCGYFGVANAQYLGAGAGGSTVDISNVGADTVDDTDAYLKLFGGIEVTPGFAIEGGYIEFGEFSAHYPLLDETDVAEGYAFTVSGLGSADLNEKLSLFFRFGVQFWTAEYNVFFSGTGVGSGEDSGTGTFYGAGLQYSINDTISLRFEFEKYTDVGEDVTINFPGLGSVETSGSDVETVGVAVTFAFN